MLFEMTGDARRCPKILRFQLLGTAPDATIATTDAVCDDPSDTVGGTISVTAVTGGTPDFTYILRDQFGNEIDRIGPTSSTTETFTGVPVGNYTIVTLDAGGCVDQDFVTIDDGDLDVVPDPVPTSSLFTRRFYQYGNYCWGCRSF